MENCVKLKKRDSREGATNYGKLFPNAHITMGILIPIPIPGPAHVTWLGNLNGELGGFTLAPIL